MRPIRTIANEIYREWKNIYFGARPRLAAMLQLETVADNYMLDTGREVVLYFLANATTFRGPVAVRIKAELKEHLSEKLTKKEREILAEFQETERQQKLTADTSYEEAFDFLASVK